MKCLSTNSNDGKPIDIKTFLLLTELGKKVMNYAKNIFSYNESHSNGYRQRTIENVDLSDATIAIYADGNTAGERLTRNTAINAKKLFIPIEITDSKLTAKTVEQAAEQIASELFKLNNPNIKLNIAGNGIYTWYKKLHVTQKDVDKLIYRIIEQVVKLLDENGLRIVSIRSGGQSGADEAGLKAAILLGIKAIFYGPKGLRFRTIDNKDVYNKKVSLYRFMPLVFTIAIHKYCNNINTGTIAKFVANKQVLYFKY